MFVQTHLLYVKFRIEICDKKIIFRNGCNFNTANNI